MDLCAPHGAIKSTLWPASRKYYIVQLGKKKKFILRVWSLMPEQSEGNNHTSKINVFPELHTIFFLLAGQKVDLFAPHGAIKSTLWPASRKK